MPKQPDPTRAVKAQSGGGVTPRTLAYHAFVIRSPVMVDRLRDLKMTSIGLGPTQYRLGFDLLELAPPISLAALAIANRA